MADRLIGSPINLADRLICSPIDLADPLIDSPINCVDRLIGCPTCTTWSFSSKSRYMVRLRKTHPAHTRPVREPATRAASPHVMPSSGAPLRERSCAGRARSEGLSEEQLPRRDAGRRRGARAQSPARPGAAQHAAQLTAPPLLSGAGKKGVERPRCCVLALVQTGAPPARRLPLPCDG